MVYDYDFWKPMRPDAARDMLAGLGAPWWIAGGWAIDLFLGRETRKHEDLDIGIFARDQLALQAHLLQRGWELHCADPPGTLRPWLIGEELPARVHDIWCRRNESAPWEFQIMLNPGGEVWVSRRDPAFSMLLADALIERDSVRCLAPQIQLHFKAKSVRPKDQADFDNAMPALSAAQREWLVAALKHTYPAHPWIARLAVDS